MNINEFEINYFLAKKDIEKGNVDQAIEGLEFFLAMFRNSVGWILPA